MSTTKQWVGRIVPANRSTTGLDPLDAKEANAKWDQQDAERLAEESHAAERAVQEAGEDEDCDGTGGGAPPPPPF